MQVSSGACVKARDVNHVRKTVRFFVIQQQSGRSDHFRFVQGPGEHRIHLHNSFVHIVILLSLFFIVECVEDAGDLWSNEILIMH